MKTLTKRKRKESVNKQYNAQKSEKLKDLQVFLNYERIP